MRKERDKVLDDLIEFFEDQEGYDMKEVVTEIVYETDLLKLENKEIKMDFIFPDECSVKWGEDDICGLDEFIDRYTELFTEGVVNVIKSYKEYGSFGGEENE